MAEMDAQTLFWIAIALAAGAAELFTLSLVFAMVAGGAVVAAVVAGLTGSVTMSVLAFAASTGLLLVGVRPPLRRYASSQQPSLTGAAALVGRDAEVTETVSVRGGLVKLAGEIWTARAARTDEVLELGSVVRVVSIDGATAVVTEPHRGTALPGGADRTQGPESSS